MTTKEIRAQIKETRKEMRSKGIKRIACFNGGLHGEVYSLNARMFRLETELQDALKREEKERFDRWRVADLDETEFGGENG